jgi:hypothetical protein
MIELFLATLLVIVAFLACLGFAARRSSSHSMVGCQNCAGPGKRCARSSNESADEPEVQL